MLAIARVLLSVAAVAWCCPSLAAVPPLMNHQGVLTTSGGAPLADGAYDLTVALYATASGPAPLWTETVTGVAVQGGFYSAVLGSATPFPAGLFRDHAELWLGVRVGGGGELPRGRLLSVGYAFEAGHAVLATTAATAQGLNCTGCIPDSALGFDLDAAVTSGATAACYDTPAELRAALDAVYAPLAHKHAGGDVTTPVAEALLAADSQALGGLPPSAYALAENSSSDTLAYNTIAMVMNFAKAHGGFQGFVAPRNVSYDFLADETRLMAGTTFRLQKGAYAYAGNVYDDFADGAVDPSRWSVDPASVHMEEHIPTAPLDPWSGEVRFEVPGKSGVLEQATVTASALDVRPIGATFECVVAFWAFADSSCGSCTNNLAEFRLVDASGHTVVLDSQTKKSWAELRGVYRVRLASFGSLKVWKDEQPLPDQSVSTLTAGPWRFAWHVRNDATTPTLAGVGLSVHPLACATGRPVTAEFLTAPLALPAAPRNLFLLPQTEAGEGILSWSASLDGGIHWEAVQPGVTHVFTTTGTALRLKLAASGATGLLPKVFGYGLMHDF